MSNNVLSRLMEIAHQLDEPIELGDLWTELFPREWAVFRSVITILKRVGAETDAGGKEFHIAFTPDDVIKAGLVLMAENGLRFTSFYTQNQIKDKLRDYLLEKGYPCEPFVGDWMRVGLIRILVQKNGFNFEAGNDHRFVPLLIDTVAFAQEELGGVEEGIPVLHAHAGEG